MSEVRIGGDVVPFRQPVVYLTESDVQTLLDMEEAIRCVRGAFLQMAAGGAQNQPRRRLTLPTGTILHQMAASFGAYMGIKFYATHPRHGANFWFHLFDAATGRHLAILEANWLGQIRTGAASAVATDALASESASVLGLIGSGFQARSQLLAIARVRRLSRVWVWSRTPQNRETFALEMSERTKLPVQAVGSARQAVEGADIITTITYAKDPVLEAGWVKPGAHINAAGSNHPQRRELPSELLRRASLIAVDNLEQARMESGDLLLGLPSQDWDSARVVELSALLQSDYKRRTPDEITVFKSHGIAIEDVAVAAQVYENAVRRKMGKRLRR